MTTALIATMLSSICTAIMVVSDRFIVTDYYEGKHRHAWIVSSVFGTILGLTLSLLVIFYGIFTGKIESFSILFASILELFWWEGIAMMAGGILVIQMLYHYFACYAEEANSTLVAAWMGVTPIAAIIAYSVLGYFFEEFSTLGELGLYWVFGVLLATLGLILFEYLLNREEQGSGVLYYKHMCMFVGLSTIYSLLLHFIFTESKGLATETIGVYALLPFYWIGFAAGGRSLLTNKKERVEFLLAWKKRIRRFLFPIIIVEIIGMLIFYFEYFGLTGLNPAYIGVVIGANVFLVYILDLLLGWYRKQIEQRGMKHVVVLGFTLTAEALPITRTSVTKICLELLIIAVTVIGIVLAS